jgi:serine/threonine protein kinase
MLIKDKVLKTLHDEAHILHRDISPNNIMLVRDDDARVLHALLIDFDYASTLENNNNVADVQVVDRFRTVGLFPFAFSSLIYPHKREHHHLWPSRSCWKGVGPSITPFGMT